MALKKTLILRRPRGGRLEGRSALIECLVAMLAVGAGISLAGHKVEAGGTLIVGMTAATSKPTTSSGI